MCLPQNSGRRHKVCDGGSSSGQRGRWAQVLMFPAGSGGFLSTKIYARLFAHTHIYTNDSKAYGTHTALSFLGETVVCAPCRRHQSLDAHLTVSRFLLRQYTPSPAMYKRTCFLLFLVAVFKIYSSIDSIQCYISFRCTASGSTFVFLMM